MNKSTHAGQKIYTRITLRLYNFIVLFFNNTFVWKYKTSKLLEQYNNNVSENHLDIGVGSGYYLKNLNSKIKKVVLMDLNLDCLEYVKNCLKGKDVLIYQIDILEDIEEKFFSKFDSVSCNYLIHCLPDNGSKEIVFKNIAKMLKSDGVAFGSTIINEYDSKLAVKIANKFNSKGIFDNENDSYESIERYISNNFGKYSVKKVGSVCVYVMSQPIK